jgi:hypothetical protein
MITLRIKRAEFEAIKSGKKTTEWRSPSLYNKRLLLKINEKGQFDRNDEIKEIIFINGYKKDSPAITMQVLSIIPVCFVQKFSDSDFKANPGEKMIEIKLGKIVK